MQQTKRTCAKEILDAAEHQRGVVDGVDLDAEELAGELRAK